MPDQTTQVHILGFSFSIPTPYVSGHVCTQAEAHALNRLLVRGTSKGLHKVLSGEMYEAERRDLPLTAETKQVIASAGEDYIAEFRAGFAEGHEEVRATKVEASRIARQLLEAQLNRQGRSLSSLSSGEQEMLLNDLVNSEKVRNEALRRVSVTREIAERAHDELLSAEGSS